MKKQYGTFPTLLQYVNEPREKWHIRGSESEALQNKNLTDFIKETERFNWNNENLNILSLLFLIILTRRPLSTGTFPIKM